MRRGSLGLLVAGLLGACSNGVAPAAGRRADFPAARRGEHVEVMHGQNIADPYRWLEDPDSPESRTWIDAQNVQTQAYLGAAAATREQLVERLLALWNYERFGVPSRYGAHYFFSKNDGLQNQNVLYVSRELGGEARVLIDPNTWSAAGTVALSTWAVSDDGKKIAYGVADAGSDWVTFRVRDVDTGQDLADEIRWTKFSGASWLKDGSGFLYSRYAEPKAGEALAESNYFQKVYLHRLGTPQSADELIYERPDHKEWGFDAQVTDDGHYLVVSVWKGTDDTRLLYLRDLRAAKSPFVELVGVWEAEYTFIDNDGSRLFFKTNRGAPRGKVIAIDALKPDSAQWRDVIGESTDTLESVQRVGDRLLATYLHDAHSRLRLFSLDGKATGDVSLPGLGSASSGDSGRQSSEVFFGFESFTAPTCVYRLDAASGATSLFKCPKVPFALDAYETRQVFFVSKDGTKIPMFLVHKKGATASGDQPTYLYGYGGFEIPLTPSFNVATIAWLELGGLYAVANLRGGGEYGDAWHDGGRLANKQNVFDDFAAAAEWLVAQGYTTTPRLAIGGRSNGGLLAGASLVQRPELFGAVLPQVGVLDMLRFHEFTIGWAWIDDYGDPRKAEDFAVLRAYSPYHNIKEGQAYPPTLITTADHDDRVVPAHSFKFAAALQHAQGGNAPILIRIETEAGHGAGKPVRKRVEETADQWTFLVRALGITPPSAQAP